VPGPPSLLSRVSLSPLCGLAQTESDPFQHEELAPPSPASLFVPSLQLPIENVQRARALGKYGLLRLT
jgi:hypothetical protein